MSFAGDGKERFASDTFHTDCVDIHASFKNGAKEGLYLLYIKKICTSPFFVALLVFTTSLFSAAYSTLIFPFITTWMAQK
jgi:hypothetical protein